jgi:hypothetical protein
MEMGAKAALVIGGGVAVAIVAAILLEGSAKAAPAAPATCPDGSPIPSGGLGSCPALGTSLGPSNQSGVTYNYTGTVQPNVMQAAQALAAVDPCACANVALVRAFQYAAGLTVNGQTDGRYGSNTQTALAFYVGSSAPAACAVQSWQGAEGTYTNPNCPGDPGPTYTGT